MVGRVLLLTAPGVDSRISEALASSGLQPLPVTLSAEQLAFAQERLEAELRAEAGE